MNPEIFENCSTILIDIAGTVGSINFTKDALFAFAKRNIDEYLTAKWEDEEVKKLVAELKGDGEDLADVAKAVERFNSLTDENSVNAGLKTLQGLLYKQGYENGELKAHVFDDIKNALEEWSKHRKICIYSTGAEEAQKQYFTHTTAGDLTSFIANYFDQTVGKKTASESYECIAKTLDVKPQEIVFLSDDIDEIKAAATAGCASVLVTREGNAEVSDDDKKDRMVVASFADLPLSSKRKSEEDVLTEEPPTKVAKIDTSAEAPKAETTEEIKEAMEVDSSESTPTVTTTDDAASIPAETTSVAADAPMESEDAKTEATTSTDSAKTEPTTSTDSVKTEPTTSTDSTKVESTTEVARAAPDTTATESKETETRDKVERTEEPATTTTTDAPATEEIMDDTPTPASTTTDSTEEKKTEDVEATKPEDKAVEKEAEAAALVTDSTENTEVKSAESEEKLAEPQAAPETTTPAAEEKTEAKQNGQENGEKTSSDVQPEKVVEENGAKTNGDAKTDENGDEKENKRDIANGTVESEETKTDEEVKPVTDEVKVKKIEDATEPAATLPVEA